MEPKTLQIDVKGPEPLNENLIRCNIYIGGICYPFWITKSEYELMMNDGVFIRDGKTVDSAGVINTTKVFLEK